MTPESHSITITVLNIILQTVALPFHVIDMANHNPYFAVFYNSIQANFFLSPRSEYGWFAAREFGGYNAAFMTLLAFLGSMLGMLINFGLGYYIFRWCKTLSIYDEERYQRIAGVFRKYLFYFLAVPPLFVLEFIPFLPLFVVACGLTRVPARHAIPAIAIARVLYYGYYLLG